MVERVGERKRGPVKGCDKCGVAVRPLASDRLICFTRHVALGASRLECEELYTVLSTSPKAATLSVEHGVKQCLSSKCYLHAWCEACETQQVFGRNDARGQAQIGGP